MKIASMFSDVLESLVKAPATQRYPVERTETPALLRGHLHWDPADCIGCSLCARDCPANALEFHVLDKKEKRFVLRYHLDRCIFCGQCVASCRRGCLELSSLEWEMATLSQNGFTIDHGEKNDIAAFNEQLAAGH